MMAMFKNTNLVILSLSPAKSVPEERAVKIGIADF